MMNLLIILCTKSNTGFWKAWRKRFCTKNLKSTSVVNGVSGGDNIIKEFSGYFSQVGQPNTTNADLVYEKRVREYLFEHSGLCNGSARAVEVSLLHECISEEGEGKVICVPVALPASTLANTPAEGNQRFHLRTESLWIPVTKPERTPPITPTWAFKP